jgi:hypothetical protein
VVNSAALLLIPPVGLLLWITHVYLTLSGSGARWARWGARWGCLGLVPLACVAMWVWHYYFVQFRPVAQPRRAPGHDNKAVERAAPASCRAFKNLAVARCTPPIVTGTATAAVAQNVGLFLSTPARFSLCQAHTQ